MEIITARPTQLPTEMKIHPVMGVRAFQQKMGGAYRAWVTARTLDRNGSGAVDTHILKSELLAAGVNQTTCSRWLSQAVSAGIMRLEVHKSGKTAFVLKGVSKVAKMLDCERIDRPILLDTQALFNEGWRSLIWEAYIAANHNGKIISREKLEEITGVNRREQVRLEKGTGVTTTANLIETGLSSDNMTGMKEFQGKAAFEYQGKIIVRLPDTRHVKSEIKTAHRGRTKKINRTLSSGSSIHASGLKRGKLRLFFTDSKSLERAFRRYCKAGWKVEELFLLERVCECRTSPSVWKVVAR